MAAFLTHAIIDGQEELIHIDKVPNGLACNCRCPHCNAPLEAKNGGEIRDHHFAHVNNKKCEGAYETMLHLLAKHALKKEGGIMLPVSESKLISDTGFVKLTNIQFEQFDEQYRIKPDAEGLLPNGERLLIEFRVTHKVDKKKRETIIKNDLKCVEIDLLWQIDEIDELRTFLSQSNNRRWWILPFEKQESTTNTGIGGGSGNQRYTNIQNQIYQLFKDGLLEIQPSQPGPSYNLKKLGYDVCEKVTSFRYFKSDLLLYRSSSKDKGYISICIRGRNRNEGSEIPKGWKIIDIIVSSVPDLNKTDYHVLRSNPNTLFHNFKYKPNQQSDSNLLEAKPVPVLSTEEENKYREELAVNSGNYNDIDEEKNSENNENIIKNREKPQQLSPFSFAELNIIYSDNKYESNKFKKFGYNNELDNLDELGYFNEKSDNLEELGYFNELDYDDDSDMKGSLYNEIMNN